jgi:hypothetical protein
MNTGGEFKVAACLLPQLTLSTLHISSPLTAQAYLPTSGEQNSLLQYYSVF